MLSLSPLVYGRLVRRHRPDRRIGCGWRLIGAAVGIRVKVDDVQIESIEQLPGYPLGRITPLPGEWGGVARASARQASGPNRSPSSAPTRGSSANSRIDQRLPLVQSH